MDDICAIIMWIATFGYLFADIPSIGRACKTKNKKLQKQKKWKKQRDTWIFYFQLLNFVRRTCQIAEKFSAEFETWCIEVSQTTKKRRDPVRRKKERKRVKSTEHKCRKFFFSL